MIWDVHECNFLKKDITRKNNNKTKQQLLKKLNKLLDDLDMENEIIKSKSDIEAINDLFYENIYKERILTYKRY